ncbi:hypothetical protein EUX98_g6145 [Antrodiella citrinella]|uniref:Uncharacterized protein n=1 Tax=Antrodiella citrinella TaxID=2447956 RepID=A0A4V3XI66_9APHY|nr:hypothetical protein EUX98_g6145 [Antrodiella citrinella]
MNQTCEELNDALEVARSKLQHLVNHEQDMRMVASSNAIALESLRSQTSYMAGEQATVTKKVEDIQNAILRATDECASIKQSNGMLSAEVDSLRAERDLIEEAAKEAQRQYDELVKSLDMALQAVKSSVVNGTVCQSYEAGHNPSLVTCDAVDGGPCILAEDVTMIVGGQPSPSAVIEAPADVVAPLRDSPPVVTVVSSSGSKHDRTETNDEVVSPRKKSKTADRDIESEVGAPGTGCLIN